MKAFIAIVLAIIALLCLMIAVGVWQIVGAYVEVGGFR